MIQTQSDVIWRDIVGYEGEYQVSNTGLVKRVAHYSTHAITGTFFLTERMLKQTINNSSNRTHGGVYKLVELSKHGKGKKFLVHRLVATAFIPNPENKPQVNHIDGDHFNNAVSNLEWCTGSENMQHAMRTGLYSAELSRKAGMTHAKPVKCIETGKHYASQGEAASDNGISLSVVQNSIKYGRPGRCGLTFVYADVGGEL